ncbi:S1C family serine protease [Mesorhizobium sp. STM 4661]|uniref:S1C family serine protease n=1 Tax=Mesorhizobium sp. STM 4661 TaxID=1297570 RepID=UPI0002C0063A|nr:S1C family serine protease [Mesorhizobium sp. STM 4661]CCV15664.1 Serine protease [Mesorhizobium sp. STM 4661]
MSDFNLSAFSDAIADIAAKAAPAMAGFATHHHRTASAFHWRDGYFVTAEEVVEAGEEIELTLASGETVKAELAGRDPSTGVALLKPAAAADVPSLARADAVRPGNLAITVGNSEGAALAVFGTVGEVGPAWRSMRGGTIDRRINLAVNAGGRFEGGPVLDAKGELIGMLLFGPRRRALVMPYETIERAVATLREKGHVARGYLGAGLHPVRDRNAYGAMVMSLDDNGPAKAAGLSLGDIIVAWNGEAVHGPRDLIRRLGPDSAGAPVTLGVVRGGEQREVAVTIGEKPLS